MSLRPIEAARQWNSRENQVMFRRRHLFNRLFVSLIFMSLFPYGAFCLHSYSRGDWGGIAGYSAFYVWAALVAFARSLQFRLRCWMGLSWFFILACYSFVTTGVVGGSWIYLICFSIFAVIFWGFWAGALTLVLNTAVVIAVWGLGLQYGLEGAGSVGVMGMEPLFSFVGLALPYLFLVSLITLSLGRLLGRLERSEQESRRALAESRNRLNLKTHELRTVRERMEGMEKMKNLGILAGDVAHDLNNMLTGLATYPEVLLMDQSLTDGTRKGLEMIQQSGRKASVVVTDLLTISRGARADHEVVNLNTVVERYLKAGDFAKAMAGHGGRVDLETALDPELPNIRGAYIHLEKMVMNLLLNGVEEASVHDAKGWVRLETTRITISGESWKADDLPELPPGDHVRLRVADNGRGFSKAQAARLHEPFFTAGRKERRGSGLGLTLVWNTVQDHGGKIQVESRASGTRFDLYFPVVEEAVGEGRSQETAVSDIRGHGQRLLIVDDLSEQRKIAGTILDNLGYEVFTAGDGMEAVNFIKKHPMDLVVMDVVLEPGISGLEAFRRMKEVYPDLRAVIASGHPDSPDVDELLALGAGQVVKKPYTVYDIGLAVKIQLSV